MSWPGGDWAPPNDGSSGSSQDRPTDVASLGRFTKTGQLGKLTPEQVERNLRLLSTSFDNLPQMSFWSPALTYTTNWHKNAVASVLAAMSLKMGRVLTPEEADALAEHRTRWCRKMAYTPPIFIATTCLFFWRGRKTYRFPFYTPKPASFSPNVFPTRSRPVLTGENAEKAWQVARFTSYAFVSQFAVSTVMTSFADTSYLVSVLQDKRLQALHELAQRKREGHGSGQHSQLPHRFPPQHEAAGSNGASPTQPYGGYEGAEAFHSRTEQQQPQPPRQPPQWSQPSPEPTTGALGDDSFLFDDASPVALSQRQQPQNPSVSSPATIDQGSAWERLRRQAQSGQAAWSQGGQRPESRAAAQQQKTEQYTYSPGEQEKAYAREQAQKEFDAMLERERRGVGDSGGRS